jgi:hypothetical protein
MKRILTSCLIALSPLTALASDHDFNAAVSSIESAYHVHRQHVPMIGMVSFCAHIATGGAVKGLKIAAFDDGSVLPDSPDLPALLQATLGSGWSLMVDSRSSGEQDAIYAHPEGHRMRLLIASYDHGDLSVVRVDLDATQLVKWMDDPVRHAHHAETN